MRLSNIAMSFNNPFQCKYICPPKVLFTANMPFGGNVTDSSITNALRYSELVRGRGPNYGSNTMVYNTINAFGYYAGAPGGSGAPPRNYF
jgi:hypothetical protein